MNVKNLSYLKKKQKKSTITKKILNEKKKTKEKQSKKKKRLFHPESNSGPPMHRATLLTLCQHTLFKLIKTC